MSLIIFCRFFRMMYHKGFGSLLSHILKELGYVVYNEYEVTKKRVQRKIHKEGNYIDKMNR